MNKIEEVNKAVKTSAPAESGRRTKESGVNTVNTFPTLGTAAPGFSKSTLLPRSGSEFLLVTTEQSKKIFGFELSLLTHVSLKFEPKHILEKLQEQLPIIKNILLVNNEIIAVLDKSAFLVTPEKSDLMDASLGGINSHISYDSIPKVLFSLTTENTIFVKENDFIVKLNPNIIALNFLIKEMITTTDITVNKDHFKETKNQILKNSRINSTVSKKYLNVAVQFINADYLPDSVFFTISEEVLVAANTQLTTDLFSIKANKELKSIDQTAKCIFTQASNLLRNATKGDDMSKCLVKPKSGLSAVPIIKLSPEYLHPALTGAIFDPVNVEKKCDEMIIKEVFKSLINERAVTIKSLDTDSLFLVPDVFKMLQFTLLKSMQFNQVGGETKTIQPTSIITPQIRVNMNVSNSLVTAIFTI